MTTTSTAASYTSEALDLDLRWWAAANDLTVGQIYLRDNALRLPRPRRRSGPQGI